jgi:ketosteroid isomerase-like protein
MLKHQGNHEGERRRRRGGRCGPDTVRGQRPVGEPGVVYFDTVPPLQYTGSADLRARFLRWFDGWEGSFEMDIRDIHILASGDLAVAYRFSRARGALKDGQKAESWVRATSCLQRSVRGWLITHEHVSWPVDVKSGHAAMDLRP